MSTPSIIVGRGNWGVKTGNLLGYSLIDSLYLPREFTCSRADNTATRVNRNGNIEGVNANVPRIDYLGGQASLLVEPSGINSMLYSQSINSWPTKTGLTITDNNAISPDGTQNASYIQQTIGGNVVSLISPVVSVASGQQQSVSFYAKAGEVTSVTLQFGTPTLWVGTARVRFMINLLTGGITITSGTGTASSVAVGNGWYRYSIVTAATVGSGTTSVQTVTGTVFSPNSGDGFYLWGVQWEQNISTPTSYIPTTTAPITRNADLISVTGVAGLIGQTEGTFYFEIDVQKTAAATRNVIEVTDGTSSNRFFARLYDDSGTQRLEVALISSGGFAARYQNLAMPAGIYKVAFAYAQNNFACFVNGVQNGITDTSGNCSASYSTINLGSAFGGVSFFNDRIRAVSLYPTRLPNVAQPGVLSLQSLTAI